MNPSSLTLPADWADLVTAARAVRAHAYAPFSKLAVGAAVSTIDGTVFSGCNVENSSFGLTICAERVAVCTAVATGARELAAICVSLPGLAVPCGSCRQFLYEFNPQLPVVLDDVTRDPATHPECVSLQDLLPRAFRLEP